MLTYEKTITQAEERKQLTNRIKEIIIDRLDLNIEPHLITDDQPLFGRGLGIDSLDALELLLAIEEEFGIALYDENMVVLGSINKIADFIEENKEG
ncbi:phosphopantetheine-binding protein [Paenibacillus melissococcoides]|uniref:Acyl carrier protein n=1 Tax=Paenibacillus melissococcoides TaxID=2912268 RepID=A0ABM9GAQ2_9BACL|nr:MULTISPECIES: phosphopantetheine-binding protein [Paenibacillus]MEB9892482.1 phosphopantetheine-binding protein [Bacillus cereus]CAH8248282.1 phosphopantetheine-binding protein [Paenibacillus melissococcoides]CAH8717948.1 phosphopantetheine-binding protein [Paenibacillus melissococcoides]CAH8719174.1 phosphopantetheine-binding protein [Paenibacillus melissococcoides]GIO78638.1 acyl carrier protein [Paenibacillus dendritiformis]